MTDPFRTSHQDQHRALDQVIARYLMAHPDKLPSQTSVLELVVWSGEHAEPDLIDIAPEALAAIAAAIERMRLAVRAGVDLIDIAPEALAAIAAATAPLPPGFQSLERPQTLASEAKQARDSVASSAQALAPGSIASQRRQGGPAMPMPPPAPKGFTPPAPRPSTSPEYSNSCAHASNRLMDYAGGSKCQDCDTVFPHYKRTP
jgi:hypothetical protein